MYRVTWNLPGVQGDTFEFLDEQVGPQADALGAAGLWKVVAGRTDGGLAVELWVDGETTANDVLSSEAAAAFRSALERLGGRIEETRGPVDELVTMHLSSLRMS